MVIVPIVNISNDEKEHVKKVFESSLYFSGFEPTRKASEGMYLLVTNKSVINKAQNETDNLLQNFVANVNQLQTKIYQKERNAHSFTTNFYHTQQNYHKTLPKLLPNQ